MFNFSISAESAVRNSRRPLSAWEIHDVKFVGTELREGTSSTGNAWKCVDIKFENENGYFNVPLWFPREGTKDGERPEYEGANGGKVVYPSNFEVFKAMISQTLQVLNPTMWEKYIEASKKFKSVDDMVNLFIKIMDKVKGAETKLKLVGKTKDGKVSAAVPRIVGINKQNEAFVADNYIGNKLFFSDYEEGQRAKMKNSKPTEMPSDPILDAPAEDKSNEDFDFDSLL